MRKLSTVCQIGLKHIQNESWLTFVVYPKQNLNTKETITNLPSPIQYTDMYMNKMQKCLFFYILTCSHENCNDPFLRIFFKFSKKKPKKKQMYLSAYIVVNILPAKWTLQERTKTKKEKATQ